VPVTKRIDQINFWLPVTSVAGGSALHLESDYGLADYAPVPVRYGQALIFDGGYLGHGSVDNTSEVTRVSFDMRFNFRGATTRQEGIDLMNRIVRRLERLSARN
jgi:ectoine hydroxylase-related dioxygenase (phytanoyl-CoA dioxygenase family)